MKWNFSHEPDVIKNINSAGYHSWKSSSGRDLDRNLIILAPFSKLRPWKLKTVKKYFITMEPSIFDTYFHGSICTFWKKKGCSFRREGGCTCFECYNKKNHSKLSRAKWPCANVRVTIYVLFNIDVTNYLSHFLLNSYFSDAKTFNC